MAEHDFIKRLGGLPAAINTIAAQTKTHTILQLYKEIQKTNIDDNPLKSIMAPIRSQSIILLNSKSPDELKLFYLLQLLPGGLTAD